MSELFPSELGPHEATSRAGYVEKLAGRGSLSKSATYDEALPDRSDAAVALYVDLQQVVKQFGAENTSLQPLRSLGMTARSDGDESTFRMRLVVR